MTRRAKFSDNDILKMLDLQQEGFSNADIARRFRVDRGVVGRILREANATDEVPDVQL